MLRFGLHCLTSRKLKTRVWLHVSCNLMMRALGRMIGVLGVGQHMAGVPNQKNHALV